LNLKKGHEERKAQYEMLGFFHLQSLASLLSKADGNGKSFA
jgi:hypothetical protein